ncbi:MAG TPA: hypothetical protein PLP23_09735 [Panacibacter sp.]|nr:hypothetical protein [Panacibacter sp.]
MKLVDARINSTWPLWQKILFRFFFIYLLLQTQPWTWLDAIPGVSYVTQYYYDFINWITDYSNRIFFHLPGDVLAPPNGSGDTSGGWASLDFSIAVAFIGCIIWSLADSKRKNYEILSYWLRTITRYFICLEALSYGIIKLFALQMPFPNYSQLATPLGDFLPMRLSWMFIGYSAPYQFFSGLMEVTAGVFLLFRKTTTLGLIIATSVFINVAMLNLAYDIPVKIFSINLVLMCLFLLSFDYSRLVAFFFYNKAIESCNLYTISFVKRWQRITRIVLKSLFILIAVGFNFYNSIDWYNAQNKVISQLPVTPGVYDVAVYCINHDTITLLASDTLRWQDIIFEKDGSGSINTKDTLFRKRYNRSYFNYEPDTTKGIIGFKKFAGDTSYIFSMKYNVPDSNLLQLRGLYKSDSLYVELKKSNRHFQLTERQFHWLSEQNR